MALRAKLAQHSADNQMLQEQVAQLQDENAARWTCTVAVSGPSLPPRTFQWGLQKFRGLFTNAAAVSAPPPVLSK